MFRRAITRRTRIGWVLFGGRDTAELTERLRRQPEAVLEADGRLVSERLACRRDVGPGVPDLARAGGKVPLLDGTVEDRADDVRELFDADRPPGGDVVDA